MIPPDFQTEITPSVRIPGRFKGWLLSGYQRIGVVSEKDGLTLVEAQRWCRRQMQEQSPAEEPWEPDGRGSDWLRRIEDAEMRGYS